MKNLIFKLKKGWRLTLRLGLLSIFIQSLFLASFKNTDAAWMRFLISLLETTFVMLSTQQLAKWRLKIFMDQVKRNSFTKYNSEWQGISVPWVLIFLGFISLEDLDSQKE